MTRDRIAEAIWRAEFRRATGKERNITWDECGQQTQNSYLYLADAVLALSKDEASK